MSAVPDGAPLISMLLPDLHGGGAERVGIDLANEFVRRGFSVDMVLMRAEGELLPYLDPRVRIIDLCVSRVRQALFPLVGYLRRARPSALIVNMWPLTFMAPAAVLMSRRRCRVLVVEHVTLSNQYRGLGFIQRIFLKASLALGFRWADECAGVSRGVADDAARLANLPANKVVLLYNPIPMRAEVSAHAKKHAEGFWPYPKGRRVISVGSLKDQKNHKLLLHAFHAMGDDKSCLLILGQGALESDLRNIADRLCISGQVVFAGFQSDPNPFYATADLFVLSSDYEGFGNVIVEALGQGTPVVSTDCPSGPREILDGGKYGTLVPVGDVEALSKAMSEALACEHDADALKLRAQDFNVDKAADAYLDLLLPDWRGQVSW